MTQNGELKRHSDMVQEENGKLQQLQSQSHKFEAQKKNTLNVFGDNIPAVLQDIERERWNEKPIGPFGRFIKLKEPQWARTIESVLASTLDSFLVTNHQDQKKLAKILESRRW